MIEDEDRADDFEPTATNDNGNGETWIRIDEAVLRIARLIGRQMAREEFKRLSATNDNHPPEQSDD